MKGLILAAGLGERLRPVTLKRAKPAVEFLNVPMLGFPYYWLRTAGLTEVAFNTHYLPDTVRHAAMHVVQPETPMHFSHEPAILGSGGGIRNARVYLDGEDHFAVANADGVILCEDPDAIKKMFEFHKSSGALATLLVCPLEGVGTKIPGVWMKPDGTVVNFGKAAKAPGASCYHFASYMFFSKRLWDYLPDGPSNILYEVLEPKIAEGEKVFAYKVDRMVWYETGSVKDYLAATQDVVSLIHDGHPLGKSAMSIIKALAPSSNWDGQRLIAAGADVRGELSGFAVVGADAVIPEKTKVSDSVILPGAVLAAGEEVRGEVRI
jgi:mannose-1-phosphate guanylyltransferase